MTDIENNHIKWDGSANRVEIPLHPFCVSSNRTQFYAAKANYFEIVFSSPFDWWFSAFLTDKMLSLKSSSPRRRFKPAILFAIQCAASMSASRRLVLIDLVSAKSSFGSFGIYYTWIIIGILRLRLETRKFEFCRGFDIPNYRFMGLSCCSDPFAYVQSKGWPIA